MGGYVGSAEATMRLRKYEKRRELQQQAAEEAKRQSDANVDAAGLRQFGVGQAEAADAAFKAETIGLVTREEFLSAKINLAERMSREAKERKQAAEDAAKLVKQQRATQKAKLASKSKLSFLGNEEDVEEADDNNEDAVTAAALPNLPTLEAGPTKKRAKLGKDPSVETHFLPDQDRAVAEINLRAQLKEEWTLRQKIIKNEPLEITYSFWDGSGHRRKLTVRKGDTIEDFLRAVREQVPVWQGCLLLTSMREWTVSVVPC
mmetsp:Transcript_8090/g.24049  ORF Transcript_8090/g.24049 Transcript_8090/m.24049 type:complete len:261 (-) Transcript_8090:658-1440(-)